MRLAAAILSFVACLGAAPQQFYNLGDFRLHGGSTLRGCRLGYRILGRLNAARSNVVLDLSYFGGTSADSIRDLGPSGFFDPADYYIIAVDALGNGVSCSPSNSTSQPGAAFPAFTIDDMVESERRLLAEHLHLAHVHAILGISMGPAAPFDAADWHAQIRAMETLDVAPGITLAQAAKRVRARMLVISSERDLVVNPAPAQEFAQLLGAQTIVLHGNCGHSAPWCEEGTLRPTIQAFLAEPAGGRRR